MWCSIVFVNKIAVTFGTKAYDGFLSKIEISTPDPYVTIFNIYIIYYIYIIDN